MKNAIKKYLFLGVFILISVFGAHSALAAGPAMTAVVSSGSITSNSASLDGTYNIGPVGVGVITTDVNFEYDTVPPTSPAYFPTKTTVQSSPAPTGSFGATITGLTPSTTYYFRSYGVNPSGFTYSKFNSFKTDPLLIVTPTVTAMPASGVTTTSATLHGSFTSSKTNAAVAFQYSTSPTLAGATNTLAQFQTALSGSFSAALTGLAPSTTYYYRADIADGLWVVYSTPILSFTTNTAVVTPPCTITKFDATPSTVTSATAQVVLTWTSTNCNNFEIDGAKGVTSPYTSIPGSDRDYNLVALNTVDGTTDKSKVSVNVNLPTPPVCTITNFGVTPSTPITPGAYVVFYWTTSNCTSANFDGAPAALSATISRNPLVGKTYILYASDGTNVASQGVTVTVVPYTGTTSTGSGTTTTGGVTTGGVTTGGTTSGSSTSGSGTSGGSTSGGSTGGAPVGGAPFATTYPMPKVSGTSVIISGIAYSNREATMRLWFEYGTTPALGASTFVQIFGTNATPSAQIYNLNPYTIYYYRLVAQNSYGLTYGSTHTFTAGGPLSKSSTTTTNNVKSSSTEGATSTDPNMTVNDYQNSLPAGAAAGSSFSGFNFMWLLFLVIVILIIIIVTRSMRLKSKEGGGHTKTSH